MRCTHIITPRRFLTGPQVLGAFGVETASGLAPRERLVVTTR